MNAAARAVLARDLVCADIADSLRSRAMHRAALSLDAPGPRDRSVVLAAARACREAARREEPLAQGRRVFLPAARALVAILRGAPDRALAILARREGMEPDEWLREAAMAPTTRRDAVRAEVWRVLRDVRDTATREAVMELLGEGREGDALSAATVGADPRRGGRL